MRGARVRLLAAALAFGCGQSSTTVDGGRDSAASDVSAPIDAGEAADTGSCTDGVKDGTETDVDCGGSVCPKCIDGDACVVATDCMSDVCAAGTCGTRAWFAESNGSDVVVAGTQTWTDASGLDLQPNLYAAGLVFLQWTGTLRFAGGGNGLCGVGERFVIDDVPTGDPTWGDSIVVQNGTTRWHEMFTTEMALPLVAGLHTISVQMTNGSGFGTCYLDGDSGLAYDRSRLAVTAYDPNDAWYVESTAETGNLAPGPFVDIPGVSTSITLATNRHVQVSLTGTQYADGVMDEGACAYRLVIDGAPLGDATYGQAIAIGDGSTGWWAPVSLKYGMDMTAGAHTISAQLSNSAAEGATCNAGQGNNAYARFRMFVTSSPTGGVNTSVESTGGPNILGSLSPWTPIGLSATFSVSAPTPVQLEMAGTEETLSGSGHCSWHFVIDGLALGDLTYGQAINVGSGATTWWTAMSLLWGQSFDAGSHTISVEVSNSSNSGDCGTNGDALPYGRARLLVRAP